MSWPLTREQPLVRARRTAVAYRMALMQADKDRCAALDAQFTAWGEHWLVPRVLTHDPDEWVKPADAASIACVGVDSLRQSRRRGLIEGRWNGRYYEYRVGDLWKLGHGPRAQRAAVTDTLPDNGTTVPPARE